MASFSNSREDNKSRKEVDNVADEQTHSTVNIPSETTQLDFGRPGTLHRVLLLPQVRANKEHLYDPVFFPLGPCHQDKVRFPLAEHFKNEVLNMMLNENDKSYALREFLKRAQEIRNFYGGLRGYTYDDNALAEMMLRDACLVVCCMELYVDSVGPGGNVNSHIFRRLGWSGIILMTHEFLMLENQVPLWGVKLLTRLTLFKGVADGNHVKEYIWTFVSMLSNPFTVERVGPREDGQEEEPLHLIELYRTSLLMKPRTRGPTRISSNLPARSVMELKAKGIPVSPSSECLTDIRFESHWFFGKLLLPTFFIGEDMELLLANLIAFEMSPETDTQFEVMSYVNFMQSLIENPKDVKELREKGVLLSSMNDEQVMKAFKELNVYGVDNFMFSEVKMKIDCHCCSKAKTWMAELDYTYFRNPWSVIALFSAAVLLCLTFLQTVYSKKSAK